MGDSATFTLTCLEDATYVVSRPIGLGTYDYEFVPDFRASHPVVIPAPVTAIARMGAADDYKRRFDQLLSLNIELVHSPDQYRLCSELPLWYPRLNGLTPRSLWFEKRPKATDVGSELGWPVFVKGARQTSKHQKSLCVAKDESEFERIMDYWDQDPILWWQPVVCRSWLNLRKVSDDASNLLPITYEFRSFWYRQQLVGFGNYWRTHSYSIPQAARESAVRAGLDAVMRLDVPFVVIDLGMLEDGTWAVIECNDGQDAGYAGVDRRGLWRRVVEIDQKGGG